MADDVLLNKAASIERCVARAREEYAKEPDTFLDDQTRQDAAILNLQRACEATIDAGNRLIRTRQLGLPQGARDVFNILAREKVIDGSLATAMKQMTGFRNIAVHDYQAVQIPIVVAIIEKHTDDLLAYARRLIELA
ncbi:MAG: type VII toxin-antitoxin system HepT family RNase toxin [Pseudomonadota bacterium]